MKRIKTAVYYIIYLKIDCYYFFLKRKQLYKLHLILIININIGLVIIIIINLLRIQDFLFDEIWNTFFKLFLFMRLHFLIIISLLISNFNYILV